MKTHKCKHTNKNTQIQTNKYQHTNTNTHKIPHIFSLSLFWIHSKLRYKYKIRFWGQNNFSNSAANTSPAPRKYKHTNKNSQRQRYKYKRNKNNFFNSVANTSPAPRSLPQHNSVPTSSWMGLVLRSKTFQRIKKESCQKLVRY